MPELPEVETVLQGLRPHLEGKVITKVTIRRYDLRWPIHQDISKKLSNQQLLKITRRAKYLVLHVAQGTVLLHLGMSGQIRIVDKKQPIGKHDHFDLEFNSGKILRFTDPRRFGAFLWAGIHYQNHPLFISLGPEPFDKKFSGKYLWQLAQSRSVSIKSFIMDNKIVVGVGNIYAAESLFLAKINPKTSVNRLTEERFSALVKAIRAILRRAIKQGGTTLKDFINSDGKPGYFSQHLNVYGRAGLPCFQCDWTLKMIIIGQRSTVYCEKCQL